MIEMTTSTTRGADLLLRNVQPRRWSVCAPDFYFYFGFDCTVIIGDGYVWSHGIAVIGHLDQGWRKSHPIAQVLHRLFRPCFEKSISVPLIGQRSDDVRSRATEVIAAWFLFWYI